MPRVEWNHERAERPFVWAYRMKYYCVSVWACVVRSGIVTRGSMYDMWGREREASNRCHNNFQRMSWLRILLKTFNNGLECGTSSFSFSSSAFRVRLRLPYASLYTVFNSRSSGVQDKKEQQKISTIVSSMYDEHTSARTSEESWSKIGTDRNKRSLRSQSLYAQEARIPLWKINKKNQNPKTKTIVANCICSWLRFWRTWIYIFTFVLTNSKLLLFYQPNQSHCNTSGPIPPAKRIDPSGDEPSVPQWLW